MRYAGHSSARIYKVWRPRRPTAVVRVNDRFRRIFVTECQRQGITLSDEIFAAIVDKVRKEKRLEFASFQPKFIVDQVVATCRFMGQAPHFEPRFIDYAVDNLRVRRNSPHKESLEQQDEKP